MSTKNVTKIATAAAAVALLASCSSGVDAAEPSVPQVCLDALDAADQVHDLSGQAFIVAGDSIDAASRMDVGQLEQLTAEIDELSPQIKSRIDEYRSSRDACVGGGRA